MTTATVHGPVDFVLLEFSEERLTGRAALEVVDLVDRGIVRIFDVTVIGRHADGEIYAVDISDESDGRLGDFSSLAWARSGLMSDEDIQEAATALEPGKLAVLLVYENLWAVPFVTAARESGGELIAGARIPGQDIDDMLQALEAADQPELTR